MAPAAAARALNIVGGGTPTWAGYEKNYLKICSISFDPYSVMKHKVN